MPDFTSLNLDFINTDPFLIFFGTFYIILGVSAFLAKRSWEEAIVLFQENRALHLMTGVMMLPISLFIIVFYNDWSTIGSTVLMVIGYLCLIKALLMLIKPKKVQNFLRFGFVQKWLWLDGLSGILIGLALLIL